MFFFVISACRPRNTRKGAVKLNPFASDVAPMTKRDWQALAAVAVIAVVAVAVCLLL